MRHRVAGAAVFAYAPGPSATHPLLEQTLVSEHDFWSATDPPEVDGDQLKLPVDGYLGSDSRDAPSVHTTLAWKWSGGVYVETSSEPPHQFSGQ